MAIPDFQTLMLPVLRFAGDGEEHTLPEMTAAMADEFGLTKEEREQRISSGTQTLIKNRVAWAQTYLRKAKLLEFPRRGVFLISKRGRKTLRENPEKVDLNYLLQFPEFVAWRTKQKPKTVEASATPTEEEKDLETKTPDEVMRAAYQAIRSSLALDLLETVKESSPVFFERLVVDLLVKMGYGGTRQETSDAVTRQSGDEGIDGMINEDPLGLGVVYVQAKRWKDQTVGSPEIQKFVGALAGKQAKRGVFITTSDFSQQARAYAEKVESRIVLINGEELAELMIDYDVGVSLADSFQLKKIDNDYFTDD